MRMNKSDNINKYIILALIAHSMFLVSFTINRSVSDITKIGETGMTIQMIILETSDEIYEKSFSSCIIEYLSSFLRKALPSNI